eukprot:TRINITY_DN26289_c0_g1_i1.p1 TRINITY_DN26289_c0_g1~~TRINITY_DN26289_c0_g1_i1.p1  ORF type:complete len:734 (+),score=204.20 TRINITY_DN26289_c0_g1_i1:113-2314(+)
MGGDAGPKKPGGSFWCAAALVVAFAATGLIAARAVSSARRKNGNRMLRLLEYTRVAPRQQQRPAEAGRTRETPRGHPIDPSVVRSLRRGERASPPPPTPLRLEPGAAHSDRAATPPPRRDPRQTGGAAALHSNRTGAAEQTPVPHRVRGAGLGAATLAPRAAPKKTHTSAPNVTAVARVASTPAPSSRAAGAASRGDALHSSTAYRFGIDLEGSGAAAAVFAHAAGRADQRRPEHAREIIFIGVGDTRDRRRYMKDPVLAKLSPGFVVSQLRGLEAIGIRHHLLLSTSTALCKDIASEVAPIQTTCATSSFLRTAAFAEPLKMYAAEPDDLFILWAQTWRYVAKAVEMGYGALRVDGDVHFAEDPYPLLWGPLLRKYSLLTQVDFAGIDQTDPAALRARKNYASADDILHRARPRCGWGRGDSELPIAPVDGYSPSGAAVCGEWRTPLVNCGLVYLRRGTKPGGGAHAVVNDTWAAVMRRLTQPPANVHPDMLIDQPYFRDAVNRWRSGGWEVVTPDTALAYLAGHCRHADCGGVAAARRQAPFVQGRLRGASPGREDGFAGLPDWFVGRACALTLPPKHPVPSGMKEVCFSRHAPGIGIGMPGTVGRAVVAVHMVYAKARKRRDVFEGFGWWDGDEARHGPQQPASSCGWVNATSARLVAVGHTFFNPPGTRQLPSKLPPPEPHRSSVLVCAAQRSGRCPCCAEVAVPSAELLLAPARQAELMDCGTFNFYD